MAIFIWNWKFTQLNSTLDISVASSDLRLKAIIWNGNSYIHVSLGIWISFHRLYIWTVSLNILWTSGWLILKKYLRAKGRGHIKSQKCQEIEKKITVVSLISEQVYGPTNIHIFPSWLCIFKYINSFFTSLETTCWCSFN